MSDKLYDEGWGFASSMDEDDDEIEEGVKEVQKLEKEKNASSNTTDLEQLARKLEQEKAASTNTIDLEPLSAALEENNPVTEFIETHLGIKRSDRETLQGVALIMLLGAKEISMENLKALNQGEILALLKDSEKEFSKETLGDPEKYGSKEGHAFYMDKFTKYLFEAMESMQRYFRYNDIHLPTKDKKLQAGDPFFNNTAAISSCLRSVAIHTEEHELNTGDLGDSERFYKNVHTDKVEDDRYHMLLDNLSLVAALGNTAEGLSVKNKGTREAYERQAKKEALEYSNYFSADGSTATAWDLHTGSIAYIHSLHPNMTKDEAQNELYNEHVKDIEKVFDRVKKTGLIDENTGSAADSADRTEKVFATTGLDEISNLKDLSTEQLDNCVKVFNATFSVLNVKETAFFANSSSKERTILDGFYINGVKAVDLAKDEMNINPDDPELNKDEAHKEWQKLEPYVCALVLKSYVTDGEPSLTYKPFTPLTYGQDDEHIKKIDIGVKSETPLLGEDVGLLQKEKVERFRKEKAEKEKHLREEERLREEKGKEEKRRQEDKKQFQEEMNAILSKNREATIGERKKEAELIRKEKDAKVQLKEKRENLRREEERQRREEERLRQEEDARKAAQFNENRKNAADFVGNVQNFHKISNDIRKQLIAIKTDLNKNGRINKKEDFANDGSTSYKKMAAALNKCIDLLDDNGSKASIQEVAEELQLLRDAGAAYMKSHSSGMLKRGALAMIGRKNFYHKYGQARFNAAEQLSQMQNLINNYSDYTVIGLGKQDVSMSELLEKSRKQMSDYDLDIALEEENEPQLIEEDGPIEENNNEPKKNARNIIAVDGLEPANNIIPKVIAHSEMLQSEFNKKKEMEKNELMNQQKNIQNNNLQENLILGENMNLNTDMKKNKRLDMDNI